MIPQTAPDTALFTPHIISTATIPILKCESCGDDLDFTDNAGIAACRSCGRNNTRPRVLDDLIKSEKTGGNQHSPCPIVGSLWETTLHGGVKMTFQPIPAGTFMMGSL